MRWSRISLILVVTSVLVGLCTGSAHAAKAKKVRPKSDRATMGIPQIVDIGDVLISEGSGPAQGVLSSSGSSLARTISKDCPDTFRLYGGPDSGEGTFQAADNVAPDRQGWTGVDFTDIGEIWQLSTFNAVNLNTHGPGNVAMWAGRTAEQEPSWMSAPGYGNDWFEELRWSSGPLQDPSRGQVVDLDFVFNYEVEPGYDFFRVQYDSAGTWNEVLTLTGTNKDSGTGIFEVPGVRFSDVATGAIEYQGNDYGGEYGDEIVIRIVVESDIGWSDEDGVFSTEAGAAQVDDITVQWHDQGQPQTSFEDFEDWVSDEWQHDTLPFVGDFTKVFALAEDIDPCRTDYAPSPIMTWIDDGTPPNNDPLQRSTGGSISPTWSYGVRGGWVVNYNGGLSYGVRALRNAAVSPPIALDVAGTCDDDGDVAAILLRYDVYKHYPVQNGIFDRPCWRFSADGVWWGPWEGPTVYIYWQGRWRLGNEQVIAIPLETAPSYVQVGLRVDDIADAFGLLGNDATPAPYLDNVRVDKVRVPGPAVEYETYLMPQDGFPPNGSIAVATQAERDALDIPIFWNATDWVPDPPVIRSLVSSWVANTTVSDVRVVWVLEKNPFFEDAIRTVPNRPEDENVDATDPLRWSGETRATLVYGDDLEGYYDASLPATDFLYPGDVFRYYLRAEDSDGRIASIPYDISTFDDGVGYHPDFFVRGLPSIHDTSGTQPRTLVVVNADARYQIQHPFRQLGYELGNDYDLYVMQGTDWLGNNHSGIGSGGGHGAIADQLRGYECIVVETDDVIGKGAGDFSDDIGVLTAWRDLPGRRAAVYFGEDIASDLISIGHPAGLTFLAEVLKVSYLSKADDYLGEQSNPAVQPVDGSFGLSYVALDGCPSPIRFDGLVPLTPAVTGHRFLDAGGNPITDIAGSVIHERQVGDDRRTEILFPYRLSKLQVPVGSGGGGLSASAGLLQDVFDYLGNPPPGGSPTDVPAPVALLSGLKSYPNPFNPAITIEFSLGREAHVELAIFNLRGQLVRTLIDEKLTEGLQQWKWTGEDSNGVPVASGVYVYRLRVGEIEKLNKIALIR